MHFWHWQTWQGRPYLTCSLLDSFSHGFFTQQFSPLSPFELTEALAPEAQPYRVKQVHGNTVLSSGEIEQTLAEWEEQAEPAFPHADGVLTEQPDQAAWVCTADCVPALIADAETGQVAAVHAGWRGTATEIVPKAIARLQAQGSQLKHLRVVLGPAIAGEVYQVSNQVAAEVGATLLPMLEQPATDDVDAMLDALRSLPKSPILNDPQPGKVRLDVRRINALQMQHLGLSPEQVAISPYCTYQTPEHFFSYRRSALKKVQWSGIVSRK